MLPGVYTAGKSNCFRIHLFLLASLPGSSGSGDTVAQGDDVRGETGFEQDAPLPVTIQLLDEAVPIDDQARSESIPVAPELVMQVGLVATFITK